MTTPPRTEWPDSTASLDRSSPADTRIPTNLITGFLGVGKTTALLDLLRTRPANSRWAVLVNEYGEVPIDGALLEEAERGGADTATNTGIDTGTATPGKGGLSIREVGGGVYLLR
jgi:hypothetical protein